MELLNIGELVDAKHRAGLPVYPENHSIPLHMGHEEHAICVAQSKKERNETLNEIEDYLSLMGNPEGTPEYYMLSKDDWMRIRAMK